MTVVQRDGGEDAIGWVGLSEIVGTLAFEGAVRANAATVIIAGRKRYEGALRRRGLATAVLTPAGNRVCRTYGDTPQQG